MKQPKVLVNCSVYGGKKMFYFIIGESGQLLPNYCENCNNSPECAQCAKKALELLVTAEKANRDALEPLHTP